MLAGFLITGLSGFYTLLYASKFSPVIEKWLINKKILIAANEKGLGFLDMARKSNHNVEYNFVKINNRLSFFIVGFKVSKD